MADFDQLLGEVHGRGLRLILDLVPNHTSDRHPWFLESRSSRSSPKRDWYIWRDPSGDGGPPNNWVSYFGSAWTFDTDTGQYYLHQFREQQPELNLRNPEVFRAMLGVMRFSLDKGVDGFRVDVIALLAKDPLFRDEPPNPAYRPERATRTCRRSSSRRTGSPTTTRRDGRRHRRHAPDRVPGGAHPRTQTD